MYISIHVYSVLTRFEQVLNEIVFSKMFQIHWYKRISFYANVGVLRRIHELMRADCFDGASPVVFQTVLTIQIS